MAAGAGTGLAAVFKAPLAGFLLRTGGNGLYLAFIAGR